MRVCAGRSICNPKLTDQTMSEVNAEVGWPIPNGPISGRAAWRGAELGPNTDWIVHFMPEELGEIDAAVRQHFADGREMDRISSATFQLPQLQERLRPPSRGTEGPQCTYSGTGPFWSVWPAQGTRAFIEKRTPNFVGR